MSVTLGTVYGTNLGSMQKISNTVLPVQYPLKYYQEIITSCGTVYLSKIAYYADIPIGLVKARLINNKNNGVLPQGVYIEVIAVLPHYQSKGAGFKMLKYVEEECKNHFQHEIFVHLATDNVHALTWYEKQGFVKSSTVLKNYYKNMPDNHSTDAYILQKHIP